MVAKEFYSEQEAGNEESNILLQDPYEEELEEEEETLSLSDLPIYSDHSISTHWGHSLSKEDGKNSQSNNNDEDEDDFFEFFSEEFTSSTTNTATAENIIFCGKLIPFKDEKGNKKKNLESNNTVQKGDAPFPYWRPNSLHKAKAVSRGVTSCDVTSFNKKGQEVKGAKGSFTCEYSSVGKVSLLRSTTKSRWFLFMFGMPRLSNNTEMELRDIRSRQSRRRKGPAMFPAPEHGEDVKVKGMMRRRNYKGLWKLLKSISVDLGCKSSSTLATDAVKATFM